MTQVRYFAAAAAAAGTEDESFPASTLGELRALMSDRHGDGFTRVLARCSTLVNGTRTDDPTATLTKADRVDVLPPFAGG